MYGKLFDSMYDGTIAANWKGLVTFQQMIILSDLDGIVDMTPSSISRRTGIPLEIIEEGIEFLEQPDKYSRTPDEQGCRIRRLDEHRPWGWYIVNHKKYRNLKDRDEVRAGNRERKRKQREKEMTQSQMSRSVTECHASSQHTDADTDTDTDTNNSASFDAFWSLYPKKVDKKKALVTWRKLSLSKQKQAIADIETRYQETKKQFIPNPTTYINGERWNDESREPEEEDSIFKVPEGGIK